MAADSKVEYRAIPFALAVLLALLAMLGPFSIDTFFPSFRAMAQEFHVSAFTLQQTLTAYMLPFAAMTLVYGPLTDALGRRRVILVSLSCYVVASLAAALAPTFATLLIFRAAQGATAGAGMMVGRAVVRDLYDGPEAQRLMSVITMIFSVAPAIAPIIGGWIHVFAGWRAVFAFVALFGIALLAAVWWQLPETHPRERRIPLAVSSLSASVWRVARHREFMLLNAASALHFISAFFYIGAAPAIVLDVWHKSETQFAYLFMPVIFGFLLGAALSGRMAGRWPPRYQSQLGLVVTITSSVLQLGALMALDHVPMAFQQFCMFAAALGVQLSGPAFSLRMLDLFPAARGSAASVQACVSMGLAAISVGVIAPACDGSMPLLTSASLVAALSASLLWRLSRSALRVSSLANAKR